MWGQDWTNIYDLVTPYPDAPETNITAKLIEMGFTPLKMFQVTNIRDFQHQALIMQKL
jgi:peptidyl-dipeptidase A